MSRRIAFLHHGAELYGADRMLLALAAGLDRRRFEPVVILPREGPLAEALREREITVETVPMAIVSREHARGRGLAELVRLAPARHRRLTAALAALRPDIVQTVSLAALGPALVARASGVPHVWHVHELMSSPRWAGAAFATAAWALADRVVANSEVVAAALRRGCPWIGGKLALIRNGIDVEDELDARPDAELRSRLGWDEHAVVFVLAGHVYPRKGHDVLLEAIERLGDRASDARFLIIGDAPPAYTDYQRRLHHRVAAAPWRDRVALVPFREDFPRVLAATDVIVVPSIEPESFGLVAVEAMALGKPVIAATHGGLLETVVDGETGRGVPPGDAPALARAIVELAESAELRRRLGQAGRERQSALFSRCRYVADFCSLYEHII